jgi:hypothetical protein
VGDWLDDLGDGEGSTAPFDGSAAVQAAHAAHARAAITTAERMII